MSKYVVCNNTRKYNELIEALKNRGVEFETTHCVNKCFKCHTSVMIKEDDKYISANTAQKLLRKINIY